MKGEKGAPPRVSLVVAMAKNRVIGKDGGIPWRLSADLRRFKALTMAHAIVMGRKTFESIGRLLPGRTTVVVTRKRGYRAPGAIVVHSLEEALEGARGDEELFVIGGEQIYRAALARADRIYLTEVESEYEGDTRFPELPPGEWREVSRERHPGGAGMPGFSFVVLERARAGARPRTANPGAAPRRPASGGTR